MPECSGCNPTIEELNAITFVVFSDVFDDVFNACCEAMKWAHGKAVEEFSEDPRFIMAMKTGLDEMLPQAIHARLHNCGPVAGHRIALS